MTSNTGIQMFEILDETEGDLVVIRVGRGTCQGYVELYLLLAQKTDEYGAVRVLEVAPDWTLLTFLSHVYGLIPDLRYGSQFRISRYAAVGDSVWAKLLFDWWSGIRPTRRSPPGKCGTSKSTTVTRHSSGSKPVMSRDTRGIFELAAGAEGGSCRSTGIKWKPITHKS